MFVETLKFFTSNFDENSHVFVPQKCQKRNSNNSVVVETLRSIKIVIFDHKPWNACYFCWYSPKKVVLYDSISRSSFWFNLYRCLCFSSFKYTACFRKSVLQMIFSWYTISSSVVTHATLMFNTFKQLIILLWLWMNNSTTAWKYLVDLYCFESFESTTKRNVINFKHKVINYICVERWIDRQQNVS